MTNSQGLDEAKCFGLRNHLGHAVTIAYSDRRSIAGDQCKNLCHRLVFSYEAE